MKNDVSLFVSLTLLSFCADDLTQTTAMPTLASGQGIRRSDHNQRGLRKICRNPWQIQGVEGGPRALDCPCYSALLLPSKSNIFFFVNRFCQLPRRPSAWGDQDCIDEVRDKEVILLLNCVAREWNVDICGKTRKSVRDALCLANNVWREQYRQGAKGDTEQ